MTFNRLFIDGSLLAGAERFSVGIAFATATDDGVIGGPALSTWAEAALTLMKSSDPGAANLRSLLGSNGGITRVRAYQYTVPGGPAVAVGQSAGSSGPGGNSVVMPPQCSLVFSLLTGRAGRSYRGRMYWPHLTGGLGADGKRAGPPTTAALASTVATTLRQLALSSGVAGLDPAVVSAVNGGDITSVIQVSVGDVVDTQRRRRDALVEVRSVGAVPA